MMKMDIQMEKIKTDFKTLETKYADLNMKVHFLEDGHQKRGDQNCDTCNSTSKYLSKIINCTKIRFQVKWRASYKDYSIYEPKEGKVEKLLWKWYMHVN